MLDSGGQLKIEALGHSAFIATISRQDGSPFRLLADPWLDDHVIGDVGGRFPRIRTDWSQQEPIDAIWLSHSHTDHLCPYSLVKLHGELKCSPRLFIPISLAYLVETLHEFLPKWPVTIIEQETPVDSGGIRLRAFFNVRETATNEDDCMILLIDNGREAILSEADAVLPMEDPSVREMVGELLLDAGPEQRIFLTTRNELEATMASVDAPDREARKQAIAQQIEETTLLAEAEISPKRCRGLPVADGINGAKLSSARGSPYPTRWWEIGINLCFRFDSKTGSGSKRKPALREQLPVHILSLQAGEVVSVEEGSPQMITTIAGIEILGGEEGRIYQEDAENFAEFPVAPLREELRDPQSQHPVILRYLQDRYLPYLIGQRFPAVEHRISAAEGQYRVRVRYGNSEKWIPRDYMIHFESLRFEEQPVAGDAQEEYWANDLDDYFQGHAR